MTDDSDSMIEAEIKCECGCSTLYVSFDDGEDCPDWANVAIFIEEEPHPSFFPRLYNALYVFWNTFFLKKKDVLGVILYRRNIGILRDAIVRVYDNMPESQHKEEQDDTDVQNG